MPTWTWDESQSESGVVHQSVQDTDHDDASVLKKGYDYQNFVEIGPDPVACWPLHEDSGSTAHDLAGTTDGSINGATVEYPGILETTAVNFDGTDDYIDCGAPALLEGNSTWTIAAWIAPRSVTGGNFGRHIVRRGGGDPWAYIVRFESSGETLSGYVNDGSGATSVSVSFSTTDVWSHVAFLGDGSDLRLFVDGQEVGTPTAFSSTIQSASGALAIGSNAGSQSLGGSVFDGRIADVRIYDTDLSASQIQTLYDVVDARSDWVSTGKTI